jgi:oligopeptide transport system substrate-binding protein
VRNSKFLLFLSFTLVLSMFLAACAGGSNQTDQGQGNEPQDEPKEEVKQVLNLIESAEIPTMDSVKGTDAVAFNVMNNVFEGLYRLGQDNEPVLGVAAEEPQVSEDGTVYTFKIRDDAKWSDGSNVTAHDFVFAWRRAVDPNVGSEYGPYMMNGVIKNADKVSAGELPLEELGVKALDDQTLEVTLERPVPYFKSLMTFPTFYPQKEEFVTEKGDQYASNSDNLLYNGPFVLTDWNGTGLSWKMVKNEHYWDKDTVKLEEINVNVVKETSTAVNLYETGEIDRVALSGEFALQYKGHEEYQTYLEPVIFWFKFNQKNEALANVNIRKAISMAIDRQAMVDNILANGSVVANYAVPKDFVFHNGKDFRDGNGDLLAYDPEKAKEYWQKGLEELGKTELELEILGGDTELSKKMDEFFKDQLEKTLPGLTIKLKEVPFKIRLDLDTKEEYDIQVAGWGPDYQDPMTFSDLWVTDGGNNHMNYSNPKYDELIEAAKTTLATDLDARWEALQEAERILMEDAAIGPLYQRGVAALQKPYVKGLVVHPFGADFSYKWAYIEK